MVSRKAIAIVLLAGCFAITAAPVHGFFQAHGFFNPSKKYGQWFKSTTWKGDLSRNAGGARVYLAGASTGKKYPYPTQQLQMTKKMWLKSSKAVKFGNPNWFDSEVIRHRADVEKHPEAMDLLAWMYEEGRGLDRDFRKAFMWYERAKLAGKTELRGSTAKIFNRLSPEDRYHAQLQLAEDIQALEAAGKPIPKGIEQVNLHVLKRQHDPGFYKLKRSYSKGQ